MSEDIARLHQPAAEVSAEALARAEEMIEREEGVQNRLRGWLARARRRASAVVMSLFHLYTAYAIVRPEHLRAIHVAFVLFLIFLIFPVARRFRHRVMWWDWCARRSRRRDRGYLIAGGDDFFDRSILPERLGHRPAASRCRCWCWRRCAAPPAGSCRSSPAASSPTRSSAPYLPAPWTHKGYEVAAPRRPHVHDARGHLRHRDRRLLDAHHPVHHLRRVPAVLGRGQVLHRLLLRGDGRQAHQRRAHRDARLVPARRPLGLGRGDHGDARLGRLPDARQGRATARTRPAGCSPPAAWARSSRRRCSARRRSSSPSSSRSRTSTCC